MVVMQDLLDRFGIEEDELAAAVNAALASMPSSASAGLPDDQSRILSAGGFTFGPETDAAGHRARSAALAEQIALLTGPDTEQVARNLGVTPSRVRHHVAAGGLYALRLGRSLRFPTFQFGPDGRPVPGLKTVLAALPAAWPAAQVAAFMTTPQADLTLGDGHPLSPADWLLVGGDTDAVVALTGPDWT